MKTRNILTLILLSLPSSAFALDLEDELLLGIPEPEQEETLPRVLAAEGPGQGQGALALGLAFLADLPALELRYTRGLGEDVDVDLELTTIGVAQRLRGGVRYRVARIEGSTLAIRGSLSEAHSTAEPFLFLGAGPGVLFSFGAPSARFTASLDVAFPFLSTSFDNRLGGAVFVRPAFGVELSIDESLGFFVEGGVSAAVESEALRSFPSVSAGLAW